MSFKTYSLKLDNKSSIDYYKDSKAAKDLFMNKVLQKCSKLINEFMMFIESNEIEKLRSREEYLIEIVLIGVLVNEYIDNARAFKYKLNYIFTILNSMRKNEILKIKVDKIRGILNTKILLKSKKINKEVSIKDMEYLIKWLEASGDFKEEGIRIKRWHLFFVELKDKDISEFMILSNFCIDNLYSISEDILSKYVANVDLYLKKYKRDHKYKENIIYCGKSKLQYYFNMVCSQIMNDIYKNRFLKTREKIVFLPSCMRQNKSKCLGIKSEKGFVCKCCSKNCNVNIINDLGKALHYSTYVVSHESSFLKLKDNNNGEIGIIGVACVLNLISGGWKAIRMGFIPQCVILDECGCSKHWLESSKMSYANTDYIKKIING
nr:DUF116 domain-containing protein [Clostridium neonatale]